MKELSREDHVFVAAVLEEVQRARAKFPKQTRETTLLALMEEVGELAQAHLQGRREDYYNEAVQVACMALRAVFD